MIYALHGFLGLASDWDFLKNRMSVHAEDLWADYQNLSLKNWAERKSLQLDAQFQNSTEPRVLLGYSMGGRLAMHLLLARPRFWSAAILVSANPGIASVDEREARKEIDHKWAQKFLKDDWKNLVAAWNKQSLFSKDKDALPRNEKDFDREILAAALEDWSLSKQEDLAVRLSQTSTPVLWLAGEQDEKYCDLLSGFAQVARSHQYQKISNAGHRVPWDNPSEFIAAIESFLPGNK